MKTFLLALLLYANCGYAHTILQPGDIAIIGFNFKDPDEFSFITMVDLDPGTVVHFTDCGWTSDNSFREREGIVTYTVSASGKKAFEVITYPDDAGFATHGVGGFFGFSMDGDQILVYQGSFANPNFIFAVNNYTGGWQSTADDNNSSSLPSELVDGYTALSLNKILNSNYNCIIDSKDKLLLLSAISNSNNWFGSDDSRIEFPNSCFKDPLPVDFVGLKVNRRNDVNELIFEVTNVVDVYHYEIQRSEDGINYQTVDLIYEEDQLTTLFFTFSDEYKLSCYYRIKLLKNDGSTLLSTAVYSVGYFEKNLNYIIVDLYGNIITSGSDKSRNEINYMINNFAKGVYIVRIFDFDVIETYKFCVP